MIHFLRSNGRSILGLALLFLLSGCRTAPIKDAHAPSTPKSFPAARPAVVRIPVTVVFPKAADLGHHLSNLFKGGVMKVQSDPRHLPGLHMEAHISTLWKEMQKPIYLDDDFYLVIRPTTLSVGMKRHVLKEPTKAHLVLEMTAQPEIVFGPPPDTKPLPRPALHRFHSGPEVFQAVSNARFSYKEANEYIRRPDLKLIGKVLSAKGDRKMALKDVRFSGEDGQVLIQVKLDYYLTSRPTAITVRLWGTPRFMPKERVVDFPDLDLDIHSSNILVKVAGLLFKSRIREEMCKKTRIPVGEKLDWVKGRIELALNRPLGKFARMRTKVDTLDVWDGYADKKGIVLRASIKGRANLEVVWN